MNYVYSYGQIHNGLLDKWLISLIISPRGTCFKNSLLGASDFLDIFHVLFCTVKWYQI